VDKKPDNAAIHESQRRLLNSSWGSRKYLQQSVDAYNIQVTMQSCLDAGAPPDLLRQIISMFRRHHAGDNQLQAIIDDVEVRFITSLECDQHGSSNSPG
jgi:hypothetical protein